MFKKLQIVTIAMSLGFCFQAWGKNFSVYTGLKPESMVDAWVIKNFSSDEEMFIEASEPGGRTLEIEECKEDAGCELIGVILKKDFDKILEGKKVRLKLRHPKTNFIASHSTTAGMTLITAGVVLAPKGGLVLAGGGLVLIAGAHAVNYFSGANDTVVHVALWGEEYEEMKKALGVIEEDLRRD